LPASAATAACASASRYSSICARPSRATSCSSITQPQPTIDGEVFGFEAAVRWRHPKLGIIPPGEFISLAEQNGMIVQIGASALHEACREAASWTAPPQIGVNLSPVQFPCGDPAGLVHLILLDTGLAAGRLELEITEGVIFDEPARTLSTRGG
jgi:EAL domain-containing protein (putative c-di-GMP-specific phosphodiesterase class I)